MKVICERGYYKFFPDSANEIAVFENIIGRTLVSVGNYYTFEKLANLPNYSIQGQEYGGIKAIKNYSGKIEDVFYENRLKYNIQDDKIESSDNLTVVGERIDNFIWIVTGIPQAYAQLQDKSVITGFQGFVNVMYNYTAVNRWENANI